jgi:hypothetical protein
MLNRRRARPLALLSLLLAAPGCVTDPDGIASVTVSPASHSCMRTPVT